MRITQATLEHLDLLTPLFVKYRAFTARLFLAWLLAWLVGGWLVAQMDLAGTAMASKVAGGRVATVAIDRMAFLVPVAVGAQLSFCYGNISLI